MTINLADNNPRIAYSLAQSATQSTFAVPFEFFDNGDLEVYVDGVLKAEGTHYSVTGGDGSTGNVIFSPQLTGISGGSSIVIFRSMPIERTSDFSGGSDINRAALNEQLDSLTAMVADLDDRIDRTIQTNGYDINPSMVLPTVAARKGKALTFDPITGAVLAAQELGQYRGNWAVSTAYVPRDLVKDTSTNNIFIAVTAHTSTGSQPLTTNTDSAKWALIVDAATATTSSTSAASSASAAATSATNASNSASAASTSASNAASSASAASTSASNAASSESAAASSASSAAASYDSFDDRYLGAKATDPTVDNDGDPLIDGALYFDTANNVMKVYDFGTTTWLRTTPTSSDQTNIDTVSGIAADVTTVAGISGNVTTVASISAEVTTVATDSTDIVTVATDIANVNTVAGISGNVTTVAGISADVTTAATNIAAIIAAPAEAAAAAASEANALVYRNDAQSARDQSQAARDTANLHKLAAEAAATSATNTAAALTGFDLDAIAASKAVTAVDVFVYDTSRDSDGGAWRKRTQHTSWYQETLNTATRGARREFPAVAVIVAEAAKITIYDGDDPALPMWWTLNRANSPTGSKNLWRTTVNATSCAARDAVVYFSLDAAGGTFAAGVCGVSFVGDFVFRRGFTTDGGFGLNASSTSKTQDMPNSYSSGIINAASNDVAVTVLPDAPIDPATGLPVPTIAVATAGGVSVIKDDGTVVDSASAVVTSVSIDQEKLSYVRVDECRVIALANIVSDGFTYDRRYNTGPTISASFLPQPLSGSNKPLISDTVSFAASSGLTRLYEDTSSQTKGMVAYTTSTYNTGWMPGDIKGAFLSDTDDTDLVGSGELVTNGTFATNDLTSWSNISVGTGSANASTGAVRLQGTDASNRGWVEQAITTVVNASYVVSINVTVDNGGTVSVSAGTTSGSAGRLDAPTTATGVITRTFVASTTTTYIGLRTSGVTDMTVDDVTVKLADADRSVNNKGLIVNGTVVRSPVATGADLVAYSGFSASNYLEQPYNSALDFGTGDFSVMGWVNGTKANNDVLLERREAAYTGNRIYVGLLTTSVFRAILGTATQFDSSAVVPANVWTHFALVRNAGTLYWYVNGQVSASTANSTDVSNATAVLRVGSAADGTTAADQSSLALLRISATAPTAEQIAKIYNDEKSLFQDGAQATLFGASDAVTALAHDPVTDLLHVGTSAGRSVFQGLRRVSNTTTAVGTAISASNGLVAEE